MRNTNIGYDAFRIICPAQELTIRQSQLVALQKQADQSPGKLPPQLDLATGFDKLGTAFAAQGDSVNALKNFDNELNACRQSAQRDPAIADCLRRVAQSIGQIGDTQLSQAVGFDQAHNATQSTQLANSAIASDQKSLAIWQQLLHFAPDDVGTQHSVALAFDRAGVALFWIGRKPEGLDAIRSAVKLLENIIDAHHGTQAINVDLLWCLYNLSQRSDNSTEAKDSLRKSLAIATELDRAHQGPDQIAGVVTFLQGELAKLH